MMKVMKSSPPLLTTNMTAQKPRAANIEACRMIEAALYEFIPSLDKFTAKRVARQLASLKGFRSLDKSTGSECLKLRLKIISKRLLEVAERRRQASSSNAPTSGNSDAKEVSSKFKKVPLDVHKDKVDRYHILISVVGKEIFNEIFSVYTDIKNIRQCSAVWTKFSQQHLPSSSCEEEGVGEEEEQQDRASASEILPAPIADIYFRTRLVDVMGVLDARSCRSCKPTEEVRDCPDQSSGCIVYRTDWFVLLQDAKSKLAAFRKFEKENVKEDEDLSFKCSSGLCGFRPSRIP